MNLELQNIANWFLANKLAVNVSKTKYIIFHAKSKKIDMTNLQIVFNSNEPNELQNPEKIIPLERISNEQPVKYYKLLGVLLDEYLSFDFYIMQLCNKLSKSIYFLRKVKNLYLLVI